MCWHVFFFFCARCSRCRSLAHSRAARVSRNAMHKMRSYSRCSGAWKMWFEWKNILHSMQTAVSINRADDPIDTGPVSFLSLFFASLSRSFDSRCQSNWNLLHLLCAPPFSVRCWDRNDTYHRRMAGPVKWGERHGGTNGQQDLPEINGRRYTNSWWCKKIHLFGRVPKFFKIVA